MVENQPGVGIDEDPPLVYVERAERGETASPQIPPQPQDEWSCPQCTLLNPARKIYCLACFHRHPDLARANVGHGSAQNYAYENQEYKEGENYEHDNTCVESTTPFEDGIESTAPFEDNLERQQGVDQNNVGSTVHDGLASSENILPGEEDPFEKKIRRRMRRKKRMVAGGAAGIVAGAVLGGPALVAAGLVGGAIGTRIVSKRQERLKDERLALKRWEAEIGQRVVKP